MNKIFLIGRLTNDPEMRYLSDSVTPVTKFTLAVDKKKGEADFIPCVTWGKLAEVTSKYLTKGNMTCVIGRLSIRPYEDKNGQRKYQTEVNVDEVKFLERRKEGQADEWGDETPF
jgi:single-strand DNA-binding protein